MRRLASRAKPILAAATAAAAAAVPARHLFSEESPLRDKKDPLHHLLPHLQSRGHAETPGTVGTMAPSRRPAETHVVRIALTGGPCAGKSSALEHIIKTAKKHGFDVYCAPETATIIFNSGVTTDIFSCPNGVFVFQEGLARMQLQMERALTKAAAVTGRPSILVMDRGLVDGKAYMDEQEWKKLLEVIGGGGDGYSNGVDEEYLLQRYDAVVHMVTAADGAESFYKWGKTTDDTGNIVVRSEPPELARSLDKKLQGVWSNHKNHIVITNDGSGFAAKLDAVSNAVISVARLKHPGLKHPG
eukprot:TRINITY_DN106555_c0_g1_i1.p1 TRINITY_DN106555_c0_g1~~TRINITY_DN106555_c0_g1_i1.p1  ORF type:complete len:301 (+),score=50.76 TRINITY_DN106555_c0_g1_i1:43-945(+)